MQLTPENYSKGFLIDEELMAGISVESPTEFAAYVLQHTTGEYLGYQKFTDLPAALSAINQIPRAWKFESSSGCGSGDCGEGPCGKGNCGQSCSITGSCEF